MCYKYSRQSCQTFAFSNNIIFILASSFGRFLRKRNQHILLSAIKSTEISTEGGYPPIPDIPTSAGILVYSFRRINFTTFSEIFITLNYTYHTFLFICRQTLSQTQNTLEKHYALRIDIHLRSFKHFEKFKSPFRNSNHSPITLHFEKHSHYFFMSRQNYLRKSVFLLFYFRTFFTKTKTKNKTKRHTSISAIKFTLISNDPTDTYHY